MVNQEALHDNQILLFTPYSSILPHTNTKMSARRRLENVSGHLAAQTTSPALAKVLEKHPDDVVSRVFVLISISTSPDV